MRVSSWWVSAFALASALGCGGGTSVVDAGAAADVPAADVPAADVPAADVPPMDVPTIEDGGASRDATAVGDGALTLGVRADRPSGCPYLGTVADTYAWAPPRARRGSCTTTQIDALRRAFVNDGYSESALRQLVGETCFSCAFSNPEVDPAWGPLLIPTPSNALPYLNVGGCMVLAGTSLGCGRASLRYQRCAYAACDGCEVQDIDTCVNDPRIYAAGAACAAARSSYLLACQNTQAAYARCWGPDGVTIEDWTGLLLTEFCGAAPDAGP